VRQGTDPVTGKQRRIIRTTEAKSKSAADKEARKLLAALEVEPIGSDLPMSSIDGPPAGADDRARCDSGVAQVEHCCVR